MNRSNLHISWLFAFLLIVLSPIAGVDSATVLMRQGGAVKGKIITQNQSVIVLQTEAGRRSISKNTVLKVLYKEVNEAEEARIRKEEENKLARSKIEAEQREMQQKEEERLAAEEEARRRELAEKKKPPAIDPKKALLRSAILPGWGQWYSERKFQGVLFPALLLAAGYVGYQKFKDYQVSVNLYNNEGNPYTKSAMLGSAVGIPTITPPSFSNPTDAYLYDKYISPIRHKQILAARDFHEYQGALYVIGAIYLVNLLDAYLFAGSAPSVAEASKLEKNTGLELNATPAYVNSSTAQGSGSQTSLEIRYSLGYRFQF
ncbi:hypothetical protein CH373_07430 [Leptospira perolatii]|uniref:DUF5683 domain-containing protein n=1 Tax=Leptospira perolatii TaxID=2023191 RepID=A0A2M9ZPU8_9LEPT|nr:DUF5683 domain-containing protein [Leptospira perolatii]PJZ70745.1 hypothetical protein CH360_04290 [Leptospira perolatii]PJZ73953.1 hypothetical protein CH373_07430 [Leptospira perolatii]